MGLVLHEGHGAQDAWLQPLFTRFNVNALENAQMTPVVFNNSYPYDPSMRPAVALNFAKYYMASYMAEVVPDPFADAKTELQYHEFHWLGDPEMMLRTDTPMELTVAHDEAVTVGQSANFTVSVEDPDGSPVGGALVCISKGDFDEEYWVGTTASEGSVTFTGLTLTQTGTYDVVVSCYNAAPYEGAINVYYWDELGVGDWGYIDGGSGNSRWFDAADNRLTTFPDDAYSDAVVRTNTVTVATDRSVRDLTVESGQVVVDQDCDFSVLRKLRLGAATGAQMLVTGDYEIDIDEDSEYSVDLDDAANGLLEATGDVSVGGTLTLQALGKLDVVGVQSRTIVQAAGQNGVIGQFAAVPEVGTFAEGPPISWAPGTYLGSGVWFGDDRTGVGVEYGSLTVDTTVFQALEGDTNGNGDVAFADFNNLANNYTGSLDPGIGGKEWRQGDFDLDQDVDFGDFNDLANNYTGTDFWYDRYRGGGEAAGGGGGAAAEGGRAGGGGVLLDGAGTADLIVDLDGGDVSIYGDDVSLNVYCVVSASGSLMPNSSPYSSYPFQFYLEKHDWTISAGSINSPVVFDEGGEEEELLWWFDHKHGEEDLVFYYGTSEGTFQGDVIYEGERDFSGGDPSWDDIAAETAALYQQQWLSQFDPAFLDELARFAAEHDSSQHGPVAEVVDQLMQLLLSDSA